MRWGAFLILMLIIAWVVVVMGRWLRKKNTEIQKRVRIAFEKHNIIDCDTVIVPCVADDQCRDNCRGGLLMRCDESGFCGRSGQRVDADVDECDISRGLITVLNALGGLVVERVCVSMYRDVVADDGSLRPYVCDGGTMHLDLEKGPFRVEDCTCRTGYTLFSYGSGSFSRPTPVCVPNALASLYERIYTRP